MLLGGIEEVAVLDVCSLGVIGKKVVVTVVVVVVVVVVVAIFVGIFMGVVVVV